MPAYDLNVQSSLTIHNGSRLLKFQDGDTVDFLGVMNQFSRIGTWSYDVQRESVDWSSETFLIHGMPASDRPVELRQAMAFYLPEDAKQLAILIKQAVASAAGYRFRFRIRRPDGKVRVVESCAAPVVAASGKVMRLVGTFQDVTDVAELDNLRQGHQVLVLRMVNASPSPIAMFDQGMRYIGCSPAWKRAFGVEPARNLVGLGHYDVVAGIDNDLRSVHGLALQGQMSGKDNDRFVRADGAAVTCDWACHPWTDSAGQPAGVVMMLNVRSVTAQVQDSTVVHILR